MKQGDIVLVPFPFSDLTSIKTRPAVVISNRHLKGEDVILAGLTSQRGGKYSISLESTDLKEGELPLKSFIRYNKVVSLKKSIVRRQVGTISPSKKKEVMKALHSLLEVK